MVLAVMLWHMDSVAALKCNDYRLESWLAGHLEKGRVHWRGELGMCMYRVVNTGREYTVARQFFSIYFKTYQSETAKSHVFHMPFEIDKSQMPYSKTASKGKKLLTVK